MKKLISLHCDGNVRRGDRRGGARIRGENRLFVNPTEGDYRIREGADFPDIRFEDIGRY